jgi:hypothetical protein
MRTTVKISLDIARKNAPKIVTAKQGDRGGSRYVQAQLLDSGLPIKAEAGQQVHLRCLMADGTSISAAGEVLADGTIQAPIHGNAMGEAGSVTADFALTKGGVTISTEDFTILVYESADSQSTALDAVQADWDENDPTAKGYIKGRPMYKTGHSVIKEGYIVTDADLGAAGVGEQNVTFAPQAVFVKGAAVRVHAVAAVDGTEAEAEDVVKEGEYDGMRYLYIGDDCGAVKGGAAPVYGFTLATAYGYGLARVYDSALVAKWFGTSNPTIAVGVWSVMQYKEEPEIVKLPKEYVDNGLVVLTMQELNYADPSGYPVGTVFVVPTGEPNDIAVT